MVTWPLSQATLELGQDEAEMARIRAIASNVEGPPPISNWWWVLPPVRVVLSLRRNEALRRQLSEVFTEADYETASAYVRKAMGWLLVGAWGIPARAV